MIAVLEALAAAYLIGGIPTAYLIVRAATGKDLRKIGSGNVGATNASRMFAKPWNIVAFLGCFLADAAKGFAPAFYLSRLLEGGPLGGWSRSTLILLVGLAAIVGHIYTPYLRFQGGKGVATSLGVFLAAAPAAMIAALAVGGAIMLVTRYVSLGSVAMGILLPAVVFYQHSGEAVLCALAVIVGAFIVFKHRSNMGRLMRGEERKMFSHEPQPAHEAK